jgi:hypothetical protein
VVLTNFGCLLIKKADSVSQRLLSDWTAEALLGLEQILSGIALLDVPRQPRPSSGQSHLRVFVTLSVLELFWMFTARLYGCRIWPNRCNLPSF